MKALPQFWLAALGVLATLIAAGFGLAWLLLPQPLSYFHSQYLSVALPNDWWCAQRGDAFLCRHVGDRDTEEGAHRARQALIVFATQPTGPNHTYSALAEHFGSPKPVDFVDGLATSIVEIGPEERQINGRRWLTSTHMHSELPHYRTRYAVTVTPDVSILVSFTAHKLFDANYLSDFETALENLVLNKAPVPQG